MLTDKFSMLFSFFLLSICLESALKKFKGPGSCAAMAIGGLSNLSDLRVLPSGVWGVGSWQTVVEGDKVWKGSGRGREGDLKGRQFSGVCD